MHAWKVGMTGLLSSDEIDELLAVGKQAYGLQPAAGI